MRKDMDIHGLVARGKLKLAADLLAEQEEAKKTWIIKNDKTGQIIERGVSTERAEELVKLNEEYFRLEEKS